MSAVWRATEQRAAGVRLLAWRPSRVVRGPPVQPTEILVNSQALRLVWTFQLFAIGRQLRLSIDHLGGDPQVARQVLTRRR